MTAKPAQEAGAFHAFRAFRALCGKTSLSAHGFPNYQFGNRKAHAQNKLSSPCWPFPASYFLAP
jgi:hypothetical protein